ncbi:MAG: hypothetical protein H7210_07315 [Pyrinomonadaceae bacterium]|nr:hypothetical protein [Phycisphaerales bacterium]
MWLPFGLQNMLARSLTFRWLLVLVIALWTPVCFCTSHADQSCEGHDDHADEKVKTHDCHHDSGDSDHSDNSDEYGDHHDGCPGHDDEGTGCDCSQLTATLVMGEQLLKTSVAIATIVAFPDIRDWLAPLSCVVGTRPVWVVPRHAPSLLHLHCALIV